MSDLDNGHWQYPEPINPDNWFGFVYRIVEINTGKEYIGKKQFWSVRRKVVKNRKNRKKVISPSNWKKYTSSSKHLNNAIDEFGKENYAFFIESLHDTKASLFYAEVERQVKDNVLRETLSNGEKKFYNKCIAGVKFIPPAESNNEAYANINNYEIMTEWCESMMAHEGENNSMWGETSPKKGLSFEEYYGRDRAESIKNKLREHNLGKKSPMKGVKMHSDE